MKKILTYLANAFKAFRHKLKSLSTKKLLTRFVGKWFMGLSKKHKIYALYFVISLTLFFSCVAPLWAVGLLALNFANAARLTNQIPFENL